MNVVLAHGFLGFRTAAGLSYFAGIADFLKAAGHRVLVTQVNPIGSIADRGLELRTQILSALDDGTLTQSSR